MRTVLAANAQWVRDRIGAFGKTTTDPELDRLARTLEEGEALVFLPRHEARYLVRISHPIDYSPTLWERAQRVGAETVVFLPDAEEWLKQEMQD